jgi:hypothetical protein
LDGSEILRPDFFFSNDFKKRVTPLIDVLAHKSSEEIRHSRVERYAVRLEFKWPGTNQPGETNPDYNWVQINNIAGLVMAAMSQTDDNGESYRATALLISVAGRRLAVLGTPQVAGATVQDVANNADMATFYADVLEFTGSQRAETGEEGLQLKEIRNFEVRACNISDNSIFPALAFDGVDTLNWQFTPSPGTEYAEPAYWGIEKSVDGLNWQIAAFEPAGTRSYSIVGTGTQFWRVRRSADGVTLLDPESNIVKATAQ